MAATETLSFDRHLRHAFAPLSGRLESGIRSLDGVIEMLRLRIEAEAQFAASLQKIIVNQKLLSYLSPSESLRKDGIDAIHADMRNEYTQRLEFLNSLNEDVYQPCVSIRELYAEKNRIFANDTKHNIKALRQHQNQFYKIKSKYEKVCKEASNARTHLLNAKLDNKISSAQILKLGTKVNSTLKTQQTWKEKYDRQQLLWNRQQIKFDDEMTSILQGMQSNEYNRMKTTKDSLNKWAVFITNLCANRNYDVKNLAQSMSIIDVDCDLQVFIKATLAQNPSKLGPNGVTPPHHALHYGKSHQNALHNLNKTSMEKSHDSKVNTKPKKKNRSSQSLHYTTYHQRNRSNNSMSLSSFGPSFTGNSQRKQSTSYSLSGQNDIIQELSQRQIRQQSTPNSIGSFFKQKFRKERSYNSQRTPDMQRENSNTISSFHADADAEVYPPPLDDDSSPIKSGLISSPTSPRMHGVNGVNGVNGAVDDPEIPASPRSVLSIDLSLEPHRHPLPHPQTQQTQSQLQPQSQPQPQPQIKRGGTKKKKLNKPKMRRKKQSNKNKINKNNSDQSSQSYKPSINGKQNTSSYIVNHHINNYTHVNNHNEAQQIIKKLTMSPKAQQIIVIKRKKSKSPSPNNRNKSASKSSDSTTSSHDDDDDGGVSVDSTPTLSGGSLDEDHFIELQPPPPLNINESTPNKPKNDTPAPKKHKKTSRSTKKYLHQSNESGNLEFAANHIRKNKISHYYAESEDDFDPLD